DAAGAVVARGDDALEVAVLERMVLDLHREAFVVGVVRRTLRDCPRPEHARHLEAEIEVQTRRGVLMHHRQGPGHRGPRRAHRLGRGIRGPFRAIGAETFRNRFASLVVAGRRHVPPTPWKASILQKGPQALPGPRWVKYTPVGYWSAPGRQLLDATCGRA